MCFFHFLLFPHCCRWQLSPSRQCVRTMLGQRLPSIAYFGDVDVGPTPSIVSLKARILKMRRAQTRMCRRFPRTATVGFVQPLIYIIYIYTIKKLKRSPSPVVLNVEYPGIANAGQLAGSLIICFRWSWLPKYNPAASSVHPLSVPSILNSSRYSYKQYCNRMTNILLLKHIFTA